MNIYQIYPKFPLKMKFCVKGVCVWGGGGGGGAGSSSTEPPLNPPLVIMEINVYCQSYSPSGLNTIGRFTGETTFVTSCLLLPHTNLSENGLL